MDPRSDERATAPDPALARRVDLVLRQLTALPTLSPIATRLMSLSSAADADFNEIAALIEADPSLTARLLSLCRRASVGMAQQVTTVKRAAVMLGLEAVQAAVLSVEIYEVLSQATGSDERRADVAEGQGFDRAGFWTHSLAVAGASEMLAEGARHLKLRPEEAFTAGLVHDLGMLLLDWTLPRTYARVIELARSKRLAVAPVERAVIGVDHHLAAKRLAEHWSLPTVLRDTMWLAGQPPESLPEVRHRPMIALVTLADAMANRMHLGWGGRWCVPEALEPLAAFVKIDMEVVEQVMARLPDAVSRRSRDLGLGESAPPEVVMRALAGANRHLADLHAQCRSQAVTARAQGRALEAIASFGAGARGVASVSEALGACFASARAVGGAGFVGAVVQARAGEPWRLALAGGAGGTGGAALGPGLEPPNDGAGAAMDLPGAVRGGRLAGAVGLLTWLAEHLTGEAAGPGDAGGGAPDVRSLHATALTGQGWPAAVLLHERDLAEDLGPALPALAACWGQCYAGAAQAEGSRRLAEALSQTTRALTETQERLAEAHSLARLGELTAGAAHEMNNPLTVISGRSQLLASRLESARDRADAQQVAEAAQRLSDLVTSLHLLARPPEVRRAAVNLADLVRGAVRRARERAGPARGAGRGAPPSLRLVVSERVSLISADEGLLSRALEEVVRNAMESGAREVLELRVEPDAGDERLVFTVRDDGPGMSAHALRHAFDPFFSEKPAGRQTGLGLSIARRLVGLHGGEIVLESEPGRGVTCTISLPRWRWAGGVPAQTSKAA